MTFFVETSFTPTIFDPIKRLWSNFGGNSASVPDRTLVFLICVLRSVIIKLIFITFEVLGLLSGFKGRKTTLRVVWHFYFSEMELNCFECEL